MPIIILIGFLNKLTSLLCIHAKYSLYHQLLFIKLFSFLLTIFIIFNFNFLLTCIHNWINPIMLHYVHIKLNPLVHVFPKIQSLLEFIIKWFERSKHFFNLFSNLRFLNSLVLLFHCRHKPTINYFRVFLQFSWCLLLFSDFFHLIFDVL